MNAPEQDNRLLTSLWVITIIQTAFAMLSGVWPLLNTAFCLLAIFGWASRWGFTVVLTLFGFYWSGWWAPLLYGRSHGFEPLAWTIAGAAIGICIDVSLASLRAEAKLK